MELKFALCRFPYHRKSELLDDILVCVFSPPSSISPSLVPLGLSLVFTNIFSTLAVTFSLTIPSVIFISFSVYLSYRFSFVLSVSLFLFRPTDRRLFLKLLFNAIRTSYIHPCPFVFPWPAISWRINCFVSFWYEPDEWDFFFVLLLLLCVRR